MRFLSLESTSERRAGAGLKLLPGQLSAMFGRPMGKCSHVSPSWFDVRAAAWPSQTREGVVVHDLAISITWPRELSLVRVRGRVETATLDICTAVEPGPSFFAPARCGRPEGNALRGPERPRHARHMVEIGGTPGPGRGGASGHLSRSLARSRPCRPGSGPGTEGRGRASVDRERDLEFCTDDRAASHSLTELLRPMDQTYWR